MPYSTELSGWATLSGLAPRLREARIARLFEVERQRPARMTLRTCGLVADFSKQAIDAAAWDALDALGHEAALPAAIDALFGGEAVNFTERRPALHMALRGSCAPPAGDEAALAEAMGRARQLAEALRAGALTGRTGRAIRTVVNLGIGGSDLGPRMAVEALAESNRGAAPEVRFVANIDPAEFDEAVRDAEQATTLFIVSSKSFTTAETLANAELARTWLRAGLGEGADTVAHFAAVSNATGAAEAFGIARERIFAIPPWVGGRFSLWSAIGLPLMIAVGTAAFDALLAGARAMDAHFRDAPLALNLPVRMALTGIWNTDLLGIETLAALPYAHRLRSLPAWLQQLEMESNGKRCRRDGSTSPVPTAPVVWGGAGTPGQHAFHQLLYQGTRRVALDFIVPVRGHDSASRALVENALAQAAALMAGRDFETATRSLLARGLAEAEASRLAPHLVSPGNQPSTTLLLPDLDPVSLGALLALYEHKVFVQGWIWGIASFDQYGVELGKEMARALAAGNASAGDPSTRALLAAAEAMRR